MVSLAGVQNHSPTTFITQSSGIRSTSSVWSMKGGILNISRDGFNVKDAINCGLTTKRSRSWIEHLPSKQRVPRSSRGGHATLLHRDFPLPKSVNGRARCPHRAASDITYASRTQLRPQPITYSSRACVLERGRSCAALVSHIRFKAIYGTSREAAQPFCASCNFPPV